MHLQQSLHTLLSLRANQMNRKRSLHTFNQRESLFNESNWHSASCVRASSCRIESTELIAQNFHFYQYKAVESIQFKMYGFRTRSCFARIHLLCISRAEEKSCTHTTSINGCVRSLIPFSWIFIYFYSTWRDFIFEYYFLTYLFGCCRLGFFRFVLFTEWEKSGTFSHLHKM